MDHMKTNFCFEKQQANGQAVYFHTDAKTPAQDKQMGAYLEYATIIYKLTAAIDTKDHYTFKHSRNVERYAGALAQKLGMDETEIRIVREAALLHDVGKLAVPEEILRKKDKLTMQEYKIAQSHVEHSAAIIRHMKQLDYLIPIVTGHHERWDGTGYPAGLKGNEIPAEARCLCIADAYDAMTSERSYSPACSIDWACRELEAKAGSQFDPDMVPVFVRLIKENSGI